jgi:outer membrane protein TolC
MNSSRHLVYFALVGVSSLWASPIQYPEANLPELENLLEKARENAPALVAQGFAQQESTARLEAAKGAYYPRLDLGGNFGVTRTSYIDGNYPDEESFGVAFNARITRPLYHWGAIEATISQARLDFNNEGLQRVLMLRAIKRSLRADYLTLLLNQTTLDTLRMRRQNAEDALGRIKMDHDQGTVSAVDTEQANVALSQSLIDIEQVEAEQQRIVADYKRNLGWDAPLALPETVPLPDAAAVLAWVEQVRSQGQDAWIADNAEVQRRQNLVLREKAELVRVVAGQRPLFNLAASAGQGQQNTSAANNVGARTLFIGIDMSWNIFDGFATAARKRETLLKQRQLERQLADYRAELQAQSANVINQISFIARQLQLDERRAVLARQAFISQETDMKEGRTAPQAFRNQKIAFNDSQQATLRSRTRLLLALNDYLDLTLPAAIDLPSH